MLGASRVTLNDRMSLYNLKEKYADDGTHDKIDPKLILGTCGRGSDGISVFLWGVATDLLIDVGFPQVTNRHYTFRLLSSSIHLSMHVLVAVVEDIDGSLNVFPQDWLTSSHQIINVVFMTLYACLLLLTDLDTDRLRQAKIHGFFTIGDGLVAGSIEFFWWLHRELAR
ncbi:hypothetical protein Tco_0668938 [Tanacetum coccineum]